MEFADVGAARLGYQLSGQGERLVALAGGSGMPAEVWELTGVTQALVQAGFRVLTYAARGVTPSDGPDAPYSIHDLADDLAGLIQHVGAPRCSVVGYSLGGFTTELLCRERPEIVEAAVLMASAGPASPVDRLVVEAEANVIEELGFLPASFTRIWEMFTGLAPHVMRDDPAQVSEWWELVGAAQSCWSSPEGQRGQSAAAAGWITDQTRLDGLAEIAAPVLVLCFEHDLLLPPAGGRQAASLIPKGSFSEVAGAAHGGLITHGPRCIEAIVTFLQDALRGGGRK